MNRDFWKRISKAPENTWFEVCGDSGYMSQRWYVTMARKLDDVWYDVTGARLSDSRPHPLYYRSVSHFPVKNPEDAP